MSKLEDQKHEFLKRAKQIEEQLAFMNEHNVRHFQSEGNEPQIEITETIRAEHVAHISQYRRLVDLIDELIAKGP